MSIGGKKKPAIRSIQEAAARTVAKASGDEMDVAAWLNEPETKKNRPRPAPRKKHPTTWPRTTKRCSAARSKSKPAAASSRDAAADLLRQMFKK